MGLRIRQMPIARWQLGVALVVLLAAAAQPAFILARSLNANALNGTADISKIHFKSPRYVRENIDADLGAQLVTYNTTTDVRFYVDGKVDDPIEGKNPMPVGTKYSEWRLYVALSAGKHTVDAKVKIKDVWYDVPQAAVIYSIDAPSASYELPNAEKRVFRPSDNPIRLKIDDEFNQFKQAVFRLYRYDDRAKKYDDFVGNFVIRRGDCTGKAGEYLLCNATDTGNWKSLDEGTYIAKLSTSTQAKNGIQAGMRDYWTPSFTIDNTPPLVSDFKIENTTDMIGKTLSVTAKATDNTGVESVTFYVARSGEDGICTADGAKLAQRGGVYVSSDGYYRATLDVSADSITTGHYCVVVVASDPAANESGASILPFTIDHTPPEVSARLTSASTMMASSGPITFAGTVGNDASSLKLFRDSNGGREFLADLATGPDGKWSYRIPKENITAGAYIFSVEASDQYENTAIRVLDPVNVTLFVPERGAGIVRLEVKPLETRLATVPPRLSATNTTTPFTATTKSVKKTEGDVPTVLGTETSKSPNELEAAAAIAATQDGWKVFGIAWYWWTAAVGGLGAVAWRVVASIRQRTGEMI